MPSQRYHATLEVDAWQFNQENAADVAALAEWCGGVLAPDGSMDVPFSPVGSMRPSDWVLRFDDGRFGRMPNDEFSTDFEQVQ